MSGTDVEEDLVEEVGPPARRRILGLPIPVLLAAVVGVTMLFFVVLLATREPATDRQVDSPLLGQQAPQIEGTTLTGRPFDSATYDGRWLVVNFFATWCVPCVREHPQLVAFQREQAEAGQANLVSVVFDDDAASVEEFFAREGGDWPVVFAEPTAISDWGVAGVPESYVVDPAGTVRYKLVGGVTAEGLTELVSG